MEKENKQSGKYQVLLIGKTGSGKSQLGNFLLGIDESFKVSGAPISETTKTVKKESKTENLEIIDSPGLFDSENRDETHYKDLIEQIKGFKYLNGILIIVNCQECKFSKDFQQMLKIICNTFFSKPLKIWDLCSVDIIVQLKNLKKLKKNYRSSEKTQLNL